MKVTGRKRWRHYKYMLLILGIKEKLNLEYMIIATIITMMLLSLPIEASPRKL
jgi:hypothetical protein